MTQSAEKLAVSVNEGAAMIGVSRTTLFRAMRLGELPRVRLRGRTLVRPADLRRWIDSSVTTEK